MNMKPIVAVAIALTVGIVTFSGVLIPAIESGVETEDVYTNTGFFYANKLTSASTDTITWDHTDPTVITVNGTDIDTTTWDSSYANVTIAFSEKWFIRFATDTNVIYLYEVDTASSSSTDYCSASNEKDFSMECSSGTATITMGTEEYSKTISGDGLIITSGNSGTYVMKKSTTKAYVLGDSLVYGSGRTDRALGQQGTSTNIMYKASVDDGAVLIGISPNTYTVTTTSVTYNEVDNGHKSLYQLSNFKVGLTDGENTGTITYNQIFVPAEVHAERTIHADASTILLFQTIPVFIVLGMIVAVVGVLYMKTRR